MKFRGEISLFIAAFIWGVAFVAQDAAADYVSPFTFTFIRFGIAAILLSAFAAVTDGAERKKLLSENKKPSELTKASVLNIVGSGAVCGAILFLMSILQQFGFMDPLMTTGKSGFLTANYILIVPILRIFLKKMPSYNVWIGVVIALVGLYFLCLAGDNVTLSWGDILVLGCAFANSFHILVIDHFVKNVNPVKMNAVQCFFVSLYSFIAMIFTEQPNIEAVGNAMLPILFCAVFSSCIAYTCQMYGQKLVRPTPGAMIMSFESVFSAIAGAVILGQMLPPEQLIGCILIFIAVIIAQIPVRSRKDKKKPGSIQ